MRPSHLCLILLTCLTAPVLLSYGWLQLQKKKVRKEVKRQIIAGKSNADLVTLKFTHEVSKTDLRWEHAREFEYQGQMYDIVRTEQRGDSIVYHCWWDREETQLNNDIRRLVAIVLHNNPEHQSQQERLLSFLKSLYDLGCSEWLLPPPSEYVADCAVGTFFCPPRPTLSPPFPPPKMV